MGPVVPLRIWRDRLRESRQRLEGLSRLLDRRSDTIAWWRSHELNGAMLLITGVSPVEDRPCTRSTGLSSGQSGRPVASRSSPQREAGILTRLPPRHFFPQPFLLRL